jgi:hypothetical protein
MKARWVAHTFRSWLMTLLALTGITITLWIIAGVYSYPVLEVLVYSTLIYFAAMAGITLNHFRKVRIIARM